MYMYAEKETPSQEPEDYKQWAYCMFNVKQMPSMEKLEEESRVGYWS